MSLDFKFTFERDSEPLRGSAKNIAGDWWRLDIGMPVLVDGKQDDIYLPAFAKIVGGKLIHWIAATQEMADAINSRVISAQVEAIEEFAEIPSQESPQPSDFPECQYGPLPLARSRYSSTAASGRRSPFGAGIQALVAAILSDHLAKPSKPPRTVRPRAGKSTKKNRREADLSRKRKSVKGAK